MAEPLRILIVGAGLAGSLAARLLGRAGHNVLVCERRGDPRAAHYIGGRSINLAISARGIDALDRAGLKSQLLERAMRMPGREIHTPGAASVNQPYSASGEHAINSVSRSALNLMLIEAAAECKNVRFGFDRACAGIDLDTTTAHFDDGTTEKADLIIGADGAFSAVRGAMQTTPRFSYSQMPMDHGYKELTIPAVQEGPFVPFALKPDALHIWPHGGSMMIALPNHDGSFTCTLFWPFTGEHSFESVDAANARAFFQKHYPDAADHMPSLEQDFTDNPVSAMTTIRCRPWFRNRTVLVGDAAHAIVPFYGQGANASFEDVVELAKQIEQHANALGDALGAYEHNRLRHGDAIADMAIENFIEMRDHTGHWRFRAAKRIERFLHRVLGDRFLPLYEMISFSLIPYDDARTRARRQWECVLTACVVGIAFLLVALVLIVANI